MNDQTKNAEPKTSIASKTWKLIKPYLLPTALLWTLHLMDILPF